jgi:hypothetical protein
VRYCMSVLLAAADLPQFLRPSVIPLHVRRERKCAAKGKTPHALAIAGPEWKELTRRWAQKPGAFSS